MKLKLNYSIENDLELDLPPNKEFKRMVKRGVEVFLKIEHGDTYTYELTATYTDDEEVYTWAGFAFYNVGVRTMEGLAALLMARFPGLTVRMETAKVSNPAPLAAFTMTEVK